MRHYWLAKHAYPAVIGPQTIFFDSRSRTFCALRTTWVYSLRTIVEAWYMPKAEYEDTASALAPLDECAAYLVNRNLLTTIASEGKRMQQIQMETAQQGIVEHAEIPHARLGPLNVARFAYSAMLAAWTFKHRTFEHLLQQLARRDEARRVRKSSCPEQVAKLVAAYWRLRPFAPFHSYTDLIDSIALVEYLSQYFVFPRLVIGVQLMPFTTHAWVQDQETVFNDTPEYVRQFTPIFSA